MSPLALMIRPHGSSPHHSLALILALTAILASKPFPLAHIISSAPSMLIALGGENSLSNSLVRSGRDRPIVVLAAPRHQHEDDARDLVGERHRGQIELVFDSLALEHPAPPQTQGITMASAMARAGAHYQKLAQVAVAHLCDAPEPRFAAGRVLARCQAEKGSELTPAREGAGVLDRGHNSRGGDRADARNGHQPLGGLVRFDRRRKLPVDRSDGLIERVDLADNERSAPRTQSGTTISPFSLKPSATMRFSP